jgi:glycine dehydrogenase
MLKFLQVKSVQELIEQAIPPTILDRTALEDNLIGNPISEHEFLAKMRAIIDKNKLYKCYIGGGYYPTITPSVIQRNLLENPGWYTAYTPYQAEVSQGRLESLINYQTMVQELTRLEFSNASLLDEGSAGG